MLFFLFVGVYRLSWCGNAAPARGRCCVSERRRTKVPPLLRSASSVRRTPVSMKQAGISTYILHPPLHTHTAFLRSPFEYSAVHTLGWKSCGTERVCSCHTSCHYFEQVSHCLHSWQSNSVCSLTSVRLGELSTQLPRPVSTGGLLLYQQVT